MPIKKNKITDNAFPCPFPKSEPTYIDKKIREDCKILFFKPMIKPIIKKTIINNVLPRPIPKYDPTKVIYIEE